MNLNKSIGEPPPGAAAKSIANNSFPSDDGASTQSGHFPVGASLLSICEAIVSNLDLESVLSTILNLTLQEMRAQEGSILLFDSQSDQLQMLASQGLPAEIASRGYIPRKGSVAEWVIENRKPTIINGRPTGRNYSSMDQTRQIFSAMCVPLQSRGIVLGTLNLNRTSPGDGPFMQHDLEGMAVLASQAAISIENSRLHEANLKSARLAAIGQTVAGLAHCIKNVLTSLQGGLSLCEMAGNKQNWELHNKGIEILQRSVHRVSSLALDMLNYSKERSCVLAPVNLPELIEEVVALTRDHAIQKSNVVESELAPDALTISADYNQLFRCVLNLVENALDANEEGGRVSISSRREDNAEARRRLSDAKHVPIVVRIADTGPGISEENRGRLFEPFFSTKGSKGTGLGLAVTKKIIQEHGGALELESPPGSPAVFAIYFQACDSASQIN